MLPSADTGWPESLRPLYEGVTGTPAAEALSASAQWRESFAQWVRGASLEERTRAGSAAWARLDAGERTPAELLFLLSSCGELLWPYEAPPSGLLHRLRWRQESVLGALQEAGDAEGAARVRKETDAVVSTVLTRYLKRHPESLLSLVGDTQCTFDGRALRFEHSVEVDLKQVLGPGAKSIGLLEQLRALLPTTPEEGRTRLAEFIRTRAARIPWREASEVLAERLFTLATSPEGRSGMSGFLACYPSGRKEPDWCARAGLLLSRTLEVGGPPEVVENLCELLARFDAPPVDGLRGALGALVGGDFESTANLEPVRFVLDHCHATLRKGEPGLVLALLWLEERLFRAAVRRGLPDAFERRSRVKLKPWASEFDHLCWLAEECAELWPRFAVGGVRPGMDELAAWRQEVSARMGRKPVLRKAAIEFFLWCAPDAASSEAELTVLALVRTETDKRLVRKLKEHPSSRVRFRVRTLQAWLQGSGKGGAASSGEPSASPGPATLTEALRHLHVTRAVPLGGRTWLRDRDLEELLFGAMSRVEAGFAARYPERFREDTAELVADLLEGLRVELKRVKADLSAMLAQGQAAPLELGFTVRRMRPAPDGEVVAIDDAVPLSLAEADDGTVVPSVPELEVPPITALQSEPVELETPAIAAPRGGGRAAREATPPSMPRPPGVEVAFILKVNVDGFIRTERVAFVQVVKLEQRGEGQWLQAFRLGREHLDALLLRTDAAFCLFLTPPFPRAECWMVPARLARGLTESHRSLSGVPRDGVQRVARSLSQWLVGELLGLWSGDERPEVLARARAEQGGPDFVVEWVLG
ncbi:hypothetical protein [Pyxidicoccus caerfyrddinensis]|uniref:hypothetical protein n=1 Tax=Pyxidicoccus caerfyrddinensis TaxID=2709663 RepID=UPI0013DB577A|nr:hypothetical protein [Pyxidicoccus caerfyrddinensis]